MQDKYFILNISVFRQMFEHISSIIKNFKFTIGDWNFQRGPEKRPIQKKEETHKLFY